MTTDDSLSKRANGSDDRDESGRFRPGHRLAGPGNPAVRRMAELQRAVHDAATPEKLTQVLTTLHRLALAGDVQAAALWLQRTLGKPPDTEPVVDMDLPPLIDAASTALAMQRVLTLVSTGELQLTAGARLVAMIREVAESTAWRALELRVAAIETGTSTHSNNGRLA